MNELYKAYSRGKAGSDQGGYYFPGDVTEAELAAPGYNVTTAGAADTAKFTVTRDWLGVVTDMRKRKCVALS